MKRKLTLTALVMAAALPFAASAQGGGMSQDAASPNPRTEAPDQRGTSDRPGTSGTNGTSTMKGGDTSSIFKELDRDKDGQVSKDEAKRSADVQARFDELDLNRDGKVSMVEWNSGGTK